MKIGTFTFHRPWNFGAVLQAYALQKWIQDRGCDCEVIDYRNVELERHYRLFPETNGSAKKFVGGIVNFPIRASRSKAFSEFREKYLNCSPVYTENDIHLANDRYDGFLFGSDQIWKNELTGDDRNYLGAFITEPRKRNAYAASFGKTDIAPELVDGYAKELSKFRNIAVREESGKTLVKQLSGREAQVVVDPVFLLDTEQWNAVCSPKRPKFKYILVYHLLGESTRLKAYAQQLSRSTGYKIVELQAFARLRKSNVIPRYADSPSDFLNWVRNAEYVITDSFHCTAFSVIFEKKFWSGIQTGKGANSTRVGNLLGHLGLQDRLLPTNMDQWDPERAISFVGARKVLQQQKAVSVNYLESVLADIGNTGDCS